MSQVPAGSSRRNGRIASCEPCRKRKSACDHKRPICIRCEQRGLASQCFYHPAPLTRLHRPSGASTQQQELQPRQQQHPREARQQEQPFEQAETRVPHEVEAEPAMDAMPAVAKSFQTDVAVVAEAVEQLHHLPYIQSLLSEYCRSSQASLVPGPIILAAGASLPIFNGESASGESSNLATRMLSQLSEPLVINEHLNVNAFLTLWTGDSLRPETLGLVYSVAARSCLLGLAPGGERNQLFIDAMYRSSTACLRVARDATTCVNDVLLWLGFENVRLAAIIEGESSSTVWRSLGRLLSDIFEFGSHREAKIGRNAPFFLAECRRRTFAAAYHKDKFIATLIERPPRLLRRYSDCRMPLDISDEELVAAPSDAKQEDFPLTSDGWHADAKYAPATWARVRYIFGVFREEILEFPFKPQDPETLAKMNNLAMRCQQTWDSLPHHLRYDPECWSRLPDNVCLMLTAIHLYYKQSYYEIHRCLDLNGAGSPAALLNTSAEILSTVLYLGKCLNRAFSLRHDFPYLVLNYGLPNAAVLAVALQRASRCDTTTQPLPPGIKRSSLVRGLSVFISHLEVLFAPGEANYDICAQAASTMTRIVDGVLDVTALPNADAHSLGPSQDLTLDQQSSHGGQSLAQLGSEAQFAGQPLEAGSDTFTMDFADWDGNTLAGIDLSTWVKNIEWTGVVGDWSNS